MTEGQTRIEKDSMGEMPVPASALYGASTQRAVLNFPISGRAVPEAVIRAYAVLKAACAAVNKDLGLLDDRRSSDIVNACALIEAGLPDHGGLGPHFPVDIFQTGSGTSTNMNVNEVISNRAIQILGGELGSKQPIHPNDHVNRSQSSNDSFPTAMHVAVAERVHQRLQIGRASCRERV